jgi:regulator of sigma E protease
VRIWGENYEDGVQAKSDEATAVQPGTDPSRAFSARPRWAQALVLLAGVTMNVLFAWLLFTITFMIGVPTAVDEANASPEAELYIASVLPDAPAGSLAPGAIVSAITYEETRIESPTPTEFSGLISEAAGEPITIETVVEGETSTTELVPEQGIVSTEPDRYAIGASLSLVETQRQALPSAVVEGLVATGNGLVTIADGLWTLISQSLVGNADYSQVAGPVGIVGMVGDAASFGFAALLSFTAIISLNLAIINLLPFPALDGGRLVFVAIEAVTQRRIPPEWAGRVNLVGFAILMLLMIAVTYNDILRLL